MHQIKRIGSPSLLRAYAGGERLAGLGAPRIVKMQLACRNAN